MTDNETQMRVFADYKPTDLARELAGDVIEKVIDPRIDDYDEMQEAVFLAFSLIRAEATLAGALAEREACAKVAEQQAKDFLSPQYATGQPISSFSERFACSQIASAIRARSAAKERDAHWTEVVQMSYPHGAVTAKDVEGERG